MFVQSFCQAQLVFTFLCSSMFHVTYIIHTLLMLPCNWMSQTVLVRITVSQYKGSCDMMQNLGCCSYWGLKTTFCNYFTVMNICSFWPLLHVNNLTCANSFVCMKNQDRFLKNFIYDHQIPDPRYDNPQYLDAFQTSQQNLAGSSNVHNFYSSPINIDNKLCCFTF